MLLQEGNKIIYHTITDYWKDTGTPEDIINANKEILKNMKSSFKGEKEENNEKEQEKKKGEKKREVERRRPYRPPAA